MTTNIDNIIGDESSRASLENADLLPHTWDLPHSELTRIANSGVKLLVVDDLKSNNWPACADKNQNKVKIAKDFIEQPAFIKEEKLATIIHEFGHMLNPAPSETTHWSKTESERVDTYMGVVAPESKPASKSELYADDYARHCRQSQNLRSALERLRTNHPKGFNTQTTQDRIDRIESDCDPILVF